VIILYRLHLELK